MSQSPIPSSSKTPAVTSSPSNFKLIFEKALKEYKKKTKHDLTAHPLASKLQPCNSPADVLTILQDQVDQFEQSRSGDERLRKWLDPTINVLYAFSQTLGEGVGLVFSPAKAIFAGAGVLLLAAKEVEASQDILIDIFERIENFFRRLEIYTKVPPTPAMTDMMVKIMVEVLDILGTATKEMKQSRARKFLKKVAGIKKLEDGLKKLDKMTNEEARMANAEVLKVARDIDKKVEVVDEKVQMIIDDGKEAAGEAKLFMQTTACNLDELKREQLLKSLKEWQSPSDPSTNHVFASDRQYEGTAEWFCKGNIFEEWKATGSLLWIHGKPGSGKSILCSAIINDITTLHKAGLAFVAYFYFDFRDVDKQSRRDLLRSLLIQLSARSDPFCDILSRLHKEHDGGIRQPSDNALMHCLKEMLTLPNQPPVYLIMDALDECPNTSGIPSAREQVLDFVKELVGLGLSSLRICATSRPEVDIRYAIEPLALCSISLHNESGQEKDITEYVKSVVYSSSNTFMKRWRDDDKDMVVQTLSERADGMFRWVFCQLETLRHCLPQNVPHILRQLPETLDETYARVLKEIGKTNQHYAHRLLQCLTVARRPLRVAELAEVLALDFEVKEGIPELKKNWRPKNEQEAVLSTCSSLIAVVSGVVQFSHFSVKEFLTSDRLATSSADISRFHILLEPAHTVIVKGCLGVLLRHRIGDANAEPLSPLAFYAAKNWANHARFENVWARVEDGIRRLFDPAKPHLEAWLGLLNIRSSRFFPGHDQNKHLGSPLYYASLCGFRDLAAHLVAENPQCVTSLGSRYPSPLVAALRSGDLHIAELLYQRGADLGIRDDSNKTLLHAASGGGYVDIVQWLFDHGVPANSPQDHYETRLYLTNGHQGHGIIVDAADDTDHTPLHWASQGGHSEVVQRLLMRGANVTTKNHMYRTPLHLASYSRDAETVRLLIEHGADVTTQDRRHRTPLHFTLSFHDDDLKQPYPNTRSRTVAETVRLLIDHGADLTALDLALCTPLHLASICAIPETVRMLIENGADVNAQDDTHSTPLHKVFQGSTTETVRLLIDHGADVNAPDWDHKTPPHVASSLDDNNDFHFNGVKPDVKADTVRLLIKHGADVTAQDKTHSTPLHIASSLASAKTVLLLLEHGADVTAKDETHSTPLHLASSPSFPVSPPRIPETVQLLIEHGADVTARDRCHRTPLHLAAATFKDYFALRIPAPGLSLANAEIVRLLIKHGAEVTSQDGACSTPLHLASYWGSPQTIRLLIEHGADVTAKDRSRRTPLHLALSKDDSSNRSYYIRENVDSVRLLIKHGADVSVQDMTLSTPLHLAAFSGSLETVRLLLENGADVTVLDENHKTPLHLASSRCHGSVKFPPRQSDELAGIVRLFIEHGVDVTAQDESHSTPLHLASSWGAPESVRLLIDSGADVTAQDGSGRTPLHLASSSDDIPPIPPYWVKVDTVRVLIDHGADVTAQDETHSTPLHFAALSGSAEIVRLLIERGADITARDRCNKTPSHLASLMDDHVHRGGMEHRMKADTVRLLINHGADMNAQDETHLTPLHLASSLGSAETVQLLIEHGADVTAQDRRHKTPLHLASSWDDSTHPAYHLPFYYERKSHVTADTVRLLIDHGADVTARDETHSMPLHLASSWGRAETVRLLIGRGADVTAQDGNHRTPLHLASSRDEGLRMRKAKSNHKTDIVQLLVRHGADVTARDDAYSTPLHLASSKGSVETVNLLIEHGADVNAQNGNHSTPLHLAASSQLAPEGNIVRLLLKHGANVDAKDGEGRTPVQIASSEGHFWIAKLLSDYVASKG